jgi:hypothetical protein
MPQCDAISPTSSAVPARKGTNSADGLAGVVMSERKRMNDADSDIRASAAGPARKRTSKAEGREVAEVLVRETMNDAGGRTACGEVPARERMDVADSDGRAGGMMLARKRMNDGRTGSTVWDRVSAGMDNTCVGQAGGEMRYKGGCTTPYYIVYLEEGGESRKDRCRQWSGGGGGLCARPTTWYNLKQDLTQPLNKSATQTIAYNLDQGLSSIPRRSPPLPMAL